MKKNLLVWGLAMSLSAGMAFTSCSDSDDEPNQGGQPEAPEEPTEVESSYFFSATGSDGQANYLRAVASLTEGSSNLRSDDDDIIETYTGTEWFTYKDKYLFRLQYNQGNNGGTSAYYLNKEGKMKARAYTYDIQRFSTFGIFGDYVITSASVDTDIKDEAGNAMKGMSVTYLDPVNEKTTNGEVIPAEDFLGNGEYVCFSGFVESNGKLYTAVIPLGVSPYGCNNGAVLPGNEDLISTDRSGAQSLTGTQYPDECWVAVYDNENFKNPTLIKTDQLSYACGRMRSQYYQTIWPADNGDIYVFSNNFSRTAGDPRLESSHKSGVMRIKAGATEFDSAYGCVDLEAQSEGNQPFYRCWSMTGSYFLCQMYTQGLTVMGTGANKMAVYDGEAKKLTYVTGLPDNVSSFCKRPYNENGKTYITVSTTDNTSVSCVYEIDPKTATAKKGLEVECGEISYAGKLIATDK